MPQDGDRARFAARLRAAREAAGLSQNSAAAAAGVPTPTWNRWESGERTPGVKSLPAIVAALAPRSRRARLLVRLVLGG